MPDAINDALPPLSPEEQKKMMLALSMGSPRVLGGLAANQPPAVAPDMPKHSMFAPSPMGLTPISPQTPPKPPIAPASERYADVSNRLAGLEATPAQEPHQNILKRILGTIGEMSTSKPISDAAYRWIHPGEVQKQRDILGLQAEQSGIAKSQDMAKEEAQTAREDAQAQKDLRPPAPKPDRTIAPETDLYYSLLDQGVPPEEAAKRASGAMAKPAEDKGFNLPPGETRYDASGKPIVTAPDKPEKPEKPPRQLMMVPQPDGSSKAIEVTPGTVVPKGAVTAAESSKASSPTPDEQRRADLAANLQENLAQLEDIVTRRPDLFGPVAGRMTTAREFIGTGDPDVAALKTIKEQLGMAQISAHGMRSGAQIERAAESIINGFRNQPQAMKQSIAAARNSIQTFMQDVTAKGGNVPGAAKQQGGGALAPEGTRVQMQDGTFQVKRGGKWQPE